MKKTIFFKKVLILTLLIGGEMSQAKNLIRIASLGQSPRGRFVAIEEYGFSGSNFSAPFSRIKVFNTLNKYKLVKESSYQISNNGQKTKGLQLVRAKSLDNAKEMLKNYNIEY